MDLDLTPTKSAEETEIDTPPHTPAAAAAAAYKECMKNHAAGMGGQAVDGCGEYMPPPSAALKDPTSLTCAAWGCHRTSTAASRSRRPPPSPRRFSMSGLPGPPRRCGRRSSTPPTCCSGSAENPVGRKRLRTKFSQEQKEKMHSFAEKLGWKMHKSDEAAVKEFCRGAAIARGVLKVWMHNKKSMFGRKESGRNLDAGFASSEKGVNGGNGDSEKEESRKGDEEEEEDDDDNGGRFRGGGVHFHHSNNNGSSSSA